MGGFMEFIFVEPISGAEFMVDIDEDSFKIIDCYSFATDVKGERWKKGKNPLFVHNKKAAKWVFRKCVVSTTSEKEYEFLHRATKSLGFSSNGILEP